MTADLRKSAAVTDADQPPTRLLVHTETGSAYALWHHCHDDWWMRARAVPSRNAPPLGDYWRRIYPPDPWPIGVGDSVYFKFREARRLEYDEYPGILFELDDEWRQTTPVRELARWQATEPWPGPPPPEDVR